MFDVNWSINLFYYSLMVSRILDYSYIREKAVIIIDTLFILSSKTDIQDIHDSSIRTPYMGYHNI